MTKAAELAKMGEVLTSSQLGGRRNVVINGGFQCWQRATSITASGFSADRWRSTTGSSGAMTVSRQEFTVGQTDVPSNPKYFFRHAQTTAFTNTGYNSDRTRIEDVRTLSGQLCTLTWYMKADASRTVRVNITQDFGGGGSPSSDVETAIVSSQAITTSWAEYTVTFTMPSISGKTIGSDEDSFIELGFDYRAEVNNTFTIDIANVQLEAGQGTPFENRSYGEELPLCQRYYQVIPKYTFFIGAVEVSTNSLRACVPVNVPFRTSPTIGNITLIVYDDDDTSFSNAAHAVFANSGSYEVDGTTGFLSVVFNGNLSGRTDNHNVTALYATDGTLDAEF